MGRERSPGTPRSGKAGLGVADTLSGRACHPDRMDDRATIRPALFRPRNCSEATQRSQLGSPQRREKVQHRRCDGRPACTPFARGRIGSRRAQVPRRVTPHAVVMVD